MSLHVPLLTMNLLTYSTIWIGQLVMKREICPVEFGSKEAGVHILFAKIVITGRAVGMSPLSREWPVLVYVCLIK